MTPTAKSEPILDVETENWLARPPDRTEKNKFQYFFDRAKTSLFCNLNRDTHIEERFKYILG